MSPESPWQRNGRVEKSTLGDQVVDDAGADMGGLGLHLLHQPGALDDVGEARVVFDVGGDHELTAGLHAGHQDGRQVGARGIDRGGVAGGAGADDQDLGMVRGGDASGSCLNISVRLRLGQARFDGSCHWRGPVRGSSRRTKPLRTADRLPAVARRGSAAHSMADPIRIPSRRSRPGKMLATGPGP